MTVANVEDFGMPIPSIGAIDWIVLAVLLGSFLLGAWRGFVFEILSLLSWIAAVLVAQLFAGPVSAVLPMGGSNDSLRYVAGFVLVFIVTIFACNFVASLIRRLVTAAGLRPIDRVLGAIFGVFRALVLALVVGLMAQLTSLSNTVWWKDSVSGPVMTEAVGAIRPVLPDRIASLLEIECCALSQIGKTGAISPLDAGALRNWGK